MSRCWASLAVSLPGARNISSKDKTKTGCQILSWSKVQNSTGCHTAMSPSHWPHPQSLSELCFACKYGKGFVYSQMWCKYRVTPLFIQTRKPHLCRVDKICFCSSHLFRYHSCLTREYQETGHRCLHEVQSPNWSQSQRKTARSWDPEARFSVSQKNIGSDKINDDICLFTRGRILLTEY